MRKNRISSSSAAGLALLGLALAATAGAAVAHRTGATPLRAAACSAVQNPDGELLIASDLPLRGASRAQATQIVDAIAFELARRGWHAGRHTLAYQSCDDSTAATGAWDSGTCAANAGHFSADPSVVAVIGPLNSGCAAAEIPVENRAPNGPLAAISPATTYVGLTHGGPGTAAGEPGTYYPTGKRSFTRLVAANDAQGAADAMLAQSLGAKALFVLDDRSAYGEGIAASVSAAARKLGISVLRRLSWDPKATSYAALAGEVAHSGAQAVFLGGVLSSGGSALIQALRASAPGVAIIAPDGFAPISDVVRQAGSAADGTYVSVAGLPNDRLPAAGKTFVKAFSESRSGASVDPYAVLAAQAVDVIVKAVNGSDGTRSAVVARLPRVRIRAGLVGPIVFDANGDLVAAPVTIYRIAGNAATTYRVVVPKSSLLTAR